MAYVPKNWSLGNSITESDLDHMETGIDEAHDGIAALDTRLHDGIAALDTRLDAAEVYTADTGWGGLGGAGEPNWTITYGLQRRIGKVVRIQIVASYSANIVSGATGGITGGSVPVYAASDLPPTLTHYFSTYGGPPGVQGYIVATTGLISLVALSAPNLTIPAGTSLIFDITYMV